MALIGCLGALDTAQKSTGSGGKKRGAAQLRVLGNTSPVLVTDLVTILERLMKVKAKRNIMKLPRNGDVQFTHANQPPIFRHVLRSLPDAALELGVIDTIAAAGNGSRLSPSEIPVALPTKPMNPEAPVLLDRMLLLLVSHSMLKCRMGEKKGKRSSRKDGKGICSRTGL
ncbi:hypothetical protein Bca52824_023073 [Brassica carinata]|uniref:O-methyltransferase dimerisation domain-containing protein n=1 Tax=Brassica carinata TaxID=52824 RepID=A0A8X7VHR7_BRACI|nr:hypothetical protein Bca52824_023073 [Brassica carinata]